MLLKVQIIFIHRYHLLGGLNRDGSYNGIDYATNYERGVFPVINLNSNVDITGGDGTSSNPYTIG